MAQDAFTLRLIAKELDVALKDARVNKITQPAKEEVIFSVYTQSGVKNLTVNANAALSHIGFVSAERENPKTAYNFCMLLRKHLLSATIKKIELVEFDRIVKITFTAKNEFFENCEKQLYAEIMGKYSNIILTQNNVILGAMKTASLDENAKRFICAGVKYALPPKQDKIDYNDYPALESAISARADLDLGDFLFSRVKGIAPSTAREIAARIEKEYDLKDTAKICRAIADFLNGNFEYKPCIFYPYEKPVDFFPFQPLTLSGNFKFYDNLLHAQSEFYRIKESSSSSDALKKKLIQALKNRENKFLKRLGIIEGKERDCADIDKDRLKGELIISNLYKLRTGMDSCELENYYDEKGSIIKISLDKNLTPQENAQKYFKRFNKQKKTLTAIAPQKIEVYDELNYLKSVYSEIDTADANELKDVESELIQTGLIASAKLQKSDKKKPVKEFTGISYFLDGFEIAVGRNNMQNDFLTRTARGNDIWLHTKHVHSSHVIIRAQGNKIPDAVIKIAAEICVYYSQARESGKTAVDYTLKKFVKKPSGAKPGFVIYTDNSTVYVDAKKHEVLIKR